MHVFQLNIDPAERIDAEKLDVTAPTIAASPNHPITGGTTCLKISGRDGQDGHGGGRPRGWLILRCFA
jgi:hypothetical protein